MSTKSKAKSKTQTKRKQLAKPPQKPEPDDFPLETSREWTGEHTQIIGQLLVDLEDKPKRETNTEAR